MTEGDKQNLIREIQHITPEHGQTIYHIGPYMLFDGSAFTEEQKEKARLELFQRAKESQIETITTDVVIERCKRDRKFYEELLMKLDEGILYPI